MRSLLLSFLAVAALSSASFAMPKEGSNLGNVKGGDFKAADAIIEKKCSSCHTRERIDRALKSGKDLGSLQASMEKKGAKLNSNEREVLGIYWKQSPLKK